jgi:hypothetical protein
MFTKKVIDVIASVLPYEEKESRLMANLIADALWKSGLVSNSSKALEEQELNIYEWTAMENDGYTHMESGVAMNMLDAFIKATEYSPSYHKYIEIEKIDREDYTKDHKELLDWHSERLKHE